LAIGNAPRERLKTREILDELAEVSQEPTEQVLLSKVVKQGYLSHTARNAAHRASFDLIGKSGDQVGNEPLSLSEKRLAQAGLSALSLGYRNRGGPMPQSRS
jgi:hypothetical protein